jgi:outer membrane protein
MMRKTIFSVLCVFCFLFTQFHGISAGGDDKPVVYDLPACVENALRNHPLIGQSQSMVSYHEHGIDLEKSQFGPHLSLHTSVVTFESSKDFTALLSTPGNALVTRETSGTNYVAGLGLAQPIYSTGSFLGLSAPSVQREMSNLEAQKFTNLKLKTDVVFDVVDAYGKVIGTLKALEIAEESLKTSELLYATALSKYKLDIINKASLLQAESVLVNQKVKIEKIRSDLEVNLSSLANKMGSDMKINQVSNDAGAFRTLLCDTDPIPPFESLIEMAHEKRNDIKAQEATIKGLMNNLDFVKSKRYPQVNLNASYFRNGNINFNDNQAFAWNVLMRLDMPLFDYGQVSAEISQQKDRINTQKEALRALRNDVFSQVRESYQNIQSLKASLTGLEKSREEAREALTLVRERYSRELADELEVLKAQDTLALIEQTLYSTEIDLVVNRASLKRAVGIDILECSGPAGRPSLKEKKAPEDSTSSGTPHMKDEKKPEVKTSLTESHEIIPVEGKAIPEGIIPLGEKQLPAAQNREIDVKTFSPPEKDKGVSPEVARSSKKKAVYTVLTGAFRSLENAEAMKHVLEAKGYTVSVKKKSDAKRGELFRVMIGEFETKEMAKAFALKLRKTDRLNAYASTKN